MKKLLVGFVVVLGVGVGGLAMAHYWGHEAMVTEATATT